MYGAINRPLPYTIFGKLLPGITNAYKFDYRLYLLLGFQLGTIRNHFDYYIPAGHIRDRLNYYGSKRRLGQLGFQ